MSRPRAPNLLRESGLPIAYAIDAADSMPAPGPEGYKVAVRSAVRSLTVMQKEAIVSRTGHHMAWRLASDEGPYLQGHDFAPAPLAYLMTGLAADVLDSIEWSLAVGGHATELRVTLQSRFTMEGSLPRGTMVGGALPPEITVFVGGADRSAVTGAVLSGVMASAAATGLAGRALTGSFSLTSHGTEVPVGRVTQLHEAPPAEVDRPAEFPKPLGGVAAEAIIAKMWDVGESTPESGVGLEPDQKRRLHLSAEAWRRADGLAVIDVAVHRPHGSTFRFLAGGPNGAAVAEAAPDALTYLSGSIGFCFMTQIGRYAKILGRSLGDYHIVQDTRFSRGDPYAHPPVAGRAAAPRTHVYLVPDDEDFAGHALDMSEQTCFVHAMCRADLRPRVKTLPG